MSNVNTFSILVLSRASVVRFNISKILSVSIVDNGVRFVCVLIPHVQTYEVNNRIISFEWFELDNPRTQRKDEMKKNEKDK